MRTKNPLDSKDIDELTEIGVYWMNKCYVMYFEKRTMEQLLKENGIDPPINEFFAKMTALQTDELRQWEKTQETIKTMSELAHDETN